MPAGCRLPTPQVQDRWRAHSGECCQQSHRTATRCWRRSSTPSTDAATGCRPATQRNSAARAGQGRNFIPADAFGGARPDYVFQTGSQGTGYYSDAVGAAAVSRSRRKAVGAAESAGETQEGVPARLDGSAAASGDGNAGGRAERKPDADDSDSEDDRGAKGRRRGVQTGIGQKVKGERKALPGRLRKKLARDREKHRSKLAN